MSLNDDLDSSVARRRRPTLGSLCLEERLFDPWRCLRTIERDYTCYSMVHNIYSRIDFFLTDVYTLQNVCKADIHNITWSDHAPVTIEVADTSTISNKPLWRNNTFLASKPKIRDEIKEKIQEYFQINDTGECSPMTVWCAHKAFTRRTLLQNASMEKKKKLQRLTKLHKSIAELNKKIPPPLLPTY